MTKINVLLVTKGNTDGCIQANDRVYYLPDGTLMCCGCGWLEKDELTPEITDFEYIIDPEHIATCINGSYMVFNKTELMQLAA